MGDLPLTRIALPEDRQLAIREAVRAATGIGFDNAPSRTATLDDAEALFRFLADPEIHAPIYNLPRPLTLESIRGMIQRNLDAKAEGTGMLFLRFDEAGEVLGYSEFEIWPEWGAGDLGGALRQDQQGHRAGVKGANRTFDWMFKALGLELIVATGALDNVRTARLLDRLGLVRKGEITSTREDGSTRQSLVWEVTRAQWDRARAGDSEA
ncbi:MAG: GNAT family N-acetyltransferase [Hyphomonadaceae bacterium]|nr:GNAT family N-acetyltransferase [Hyphomonadaceae bacterium]